MKDLSERDKVIHTLKNISDRGGIEALNYLLKEPNFISESRRNYCLQFIIQEKITSVEANSEEFSILVYRDYFLIAKLIHHVSLVSIQRRNHLYRMGTRGELCRGYSISFNNKFKCCKKKHSGADLCMERPELTRLYQCYSMDFVADQLFDGRKFRSLTLVDNFSRECLEIHVGQSLKGGDVVAVMERLKNERGIIPKRIQVDNGSEFISKDFDRWAYENNVFLDFSRPGKPTDNPFIESFNGSFRDECLNVNWFLSIEDATQKIQLFKVEYNEYRPHSSLGGLTPSEVVQRSKKDPNFSTLHLS